MAIILYMTNSSIQPELWDECIRRVYWAGIGSGKEEEDKALRRQIWPYLLGVFEWTENPEPKTTLFTEKYRDDVEEWRVLEAEVRRRDEEAFNAGWSFLFSVLPFHS